MDPEARPNPLSKVETIEQLRTTIEKLETIIDQLNSTSIVYLPSADSVETLITTTEELENAIANMPPEEVVAESQITPTSNEVTVESSEVSSITSQQESFEKKAESAETLLEPEPPTAQTPEKIEPIVEKKVTKSVNQAKPKKTKIKKKKNWIAIVLVTLLVAIIPIGIKYLPLGSNQQILAKNTTEIIAEEPSVTATDLSENKLPENIINPIPITEVEEEITISSREIEKQPIEQEPPEIAISPSARRYEIADSVTEQVIDSNLEKPVPEEETDSILSPKTHSEISRINSQLEEIVTSDLDELQAISPKVSSTVEDRVDQSTEKQLIDETAALETEKITESIPEPEATISVPENIAAGVSANTLDVKTVIQEVKLTSEQNLIAVLQGKILQFSKDYQSDLVTSIEPNIANNILIVKISNDWYQLDSTEQDIIVADMYKKSQELKFRKLEIKDQDSNLVARSPVIGQNMIVYLRKKENL